MVHSQRNIHKQPHSMKESKGEKHSYQKRNLSNHAFIKTNGQKYSLNPNLLFFTRQTPKGGLDPLTSPTRDRLTRRLGHKTVYQYRQKHWDTHTHTANWSHTVKLTNTHTNNTSKGNWCENKYMMTSGTYILHIWKKTDWQTNPIRRCFLQQKPKTHPVKEESTFSQKKLTTNHD